MMFDNIFPVKSALCETHAVRKKHSARTAAQSTPFDDDAIVTEPARDRTHTRDINA